MWERTAPFQRLDREKRSCRVAEACKHAKYAIKCHTAAVHVRCVATAKVVLDQPPIVEWGRSAGVEGLSEVSCSVCRHGRPGIR